MRVLVAETSWAAAAAAHDLSDAGFLTTRCEDISAFLDFIAFGQQNALILGEDRRGLGTLRVVEQVRQADAVTPIVVLGAQADRDTRVKLLQAGADAVLDPGTPAAALVAQVRAMVLRRAGQPWPVLDLDGARVDTAARQVQSAFGAKVPLTRLEYEIVEMLALHRDTVIDPDRIMAQLYAWENEPTQKVLHVYTCMIRQKFRRAGVNRDPIQTVHGRGYMIAKHVVEDVPFLRAA